MPRQSSSVRVVARRAANATGLAALILVAACNHSAAWDDQWARCHAAAIEQGEFAEVERGQRTTWRERYIGACMQANGFSDPQYLFR
ncbi:MAG: hypothetical protein AAF637_19330 [Pseudomonadota bacterium]